MTALQELIEILNESQKFIMTKLSNNNYGYNNV